MGKNCRNCVNCVNQTYDGKVQAVARCVHVGFLKAGFGRSEAQAPPGSKLELLYECKTDRMAQGDIISLNKDEFYYYDLIDVRAGNFRICKHWKHPLANAKEVLSYYGYSEQYILDFPEVHPVLKRWISEGQLKVQKHFPKLNPNHMFEYDSSVVPEEVTESYGACASCQFYLPEITEEGVPVPYKGHCSVNKGPTDFLFGEIDQAVPVTFSFNGCLKFKPNPIHGGGIPQDLPPKLVVNVETNPIDFTIEQYQRMYRSPLISRSRAIEPAEYDSLMGTQLVPLLRKRHGQIDFNSFLGDFSLSPVNTFFSKGLMQGSAALKKHYSKISHYSKADDSLFGEKPANKFTVPKV
jgi:hypothetical protein